MKNKECYNCGSHKAGSIINGVQLCYDCQREIDEYNDRERHADEARLGPDAWQDDNEVGQ